MFQILSQKYRISGVAVTKQGGRPENQDDLGWAETPLGFLLVVCDGMGGGPGGKTASYIAKTEMMAVMMNSSHQASCVDALKKAVSQANEAIYRKMDEVHSLRGMGSTLVALLVNEHSAFVVHLGDSRCYQIRNGRIHYRSADHSLVGEMVRNKALTEEQARQSPQSNIIMRALGNTSNHAPEIVELPYRKGDRFLLCTDGVWGIMPHEQLVQRLTSMQDLESLASNLSAEIDQTGFALGGHHDNHTLAVVEMNNNSILKGKMEKISKIAIAILAVLLAISISLNLIAGKGATGMDDTVPLYRALEEKTAEVEKLKAYQKLYNDIKDSDSKELITRVEVLEYEKASLEDYVDELIARIDSLEKKVEEMTNATKSKNSAQATMAKSSAGETAQRIINRLESLKSFSGKDYAKTLAQKALYRNQAVALLTELNQLTSNKYKPTIEAVTRELKHARSEALLVGLNKDKVYISTAAASKKIDQLTGKIKSIKDNCK